MVAANTKQKMVVNLFIVRIMPKGIKRARKPIVFRHLGSLIGCEREGGLETKAEMPNTELCRKIISRPLFAFGIMHFAFSIEHSAVACRTFAP